MTKTIELTDVTVNKITIDYTAQCVKVDYGASDFEGNVWVTGSAFFWVTLPAAPTQNDFQLPAGYIPTLVQMRDDARTAIIGRFLQ